MNPDTVTVAQLFEFDEIVDVRSPAEFAHDHVPGSVNCPVLDDEERARVGTLYVQDSPFTARRVGAALVARNVARHVEEKFADRPKTWRALVYCWRGGQRSAAMTHVLRQIGWDARRLAGGYKAYRRRVVAELEALAPRFDYRVVCGLTGSGKSALLRHLRQRGAQVLDLEHLAAHRGSLLGDLPAQPQPSQKMFESRLWQEIRQLHPGNPVYVESESRKIGNLQVPEPLLSRMWQSRCVWLETPMAVRVELLLHDYRHFVETPVALNARLDCLVATHGREKIQAWKNMARDGDWNHFITQLLEVHYDPAYSKSTTGHYLRLSEAPTLRLTGSGDGHFQQLVQALLGEALTTVPD